MQNTLELNPRVSCCDIIDNLNKVKINIIIYHLVYNPQNHDFGTCLCSYFNFKIHCNMSTVMASVVSAETLTRFVFRCIGVF